MAFNGFDDDGRSCVVLRDLQHAFEMLLKAALVQRRVRVFDKQLGRSIGFEKCVNVSQNHLGVSEGEAGTLRAIDALRDDEQHWHLTISEGILYAHVRASVTLFDELLDRCFSEALVDHLPHRVLPISSEPPRSIQLLIDEEYTQIAALLRPGRRQGAEARARIRSLLALEAHTTEGVLVSEKDVDRVERAIKARRQRDAVFPRLSDLDSEVEGEGITVKVRFVKKEGMPVTFIGADDPAEAAAVREVDLQKKFYMSKPELASRLDLTQPKAHALRTALGIDDDTSCVHTFAFNKTEIPRYSDNALVKMRAALETQDIDEIWDEYRPRRKKPRTNRTGG